MPIIVSVKSLRRICVNFVTDNMVKFSRKSLQSELVAIGSEDFPFCSFNEIPSAVLEEIVMVLREKKEEYRKFIDLLMVPNLRTLDLSICKKRDLLYFLPLAARKSPNLTNLVISDHCYTDSYFSLIQTFTQLQILDISNTSTPDDCFNLLGSNCKDLRELYASDCTVTDAGISGLCVVGQCKSIQILNVFGTNVTHKGIIMALEHLPSLRKLEHFSTCAVLDQIYTRAVDQKLSDIPKFSLTSINNFTTNWNINLGPAVFLCPLITEISIHGNLETLTDKDLLGLLPLEKLENLTISGYRTANLTFDGGLAPFLKARGSSLKQLSLSIVHEVDQDISSIAQYCSNLRSLSLHYIPRYSMSLSASQRNSFRRQLDKLKQPILKYLERLFLKNSNGILPESLCLLLSSPSLKFIDITSCDTFTNDVLRQTANLHSFCNLESFEMHDCKLATIKILEVLLQETNHLKKIWLTWKQQKEPKNISKILRHWEKKKEKKHWDMTIMVNFNYHGEDESSIEDSEESSFTEDDYEIILTD